MCPGGGGQLLLSLFPGNGTVSSYALSYDPTMKFCHGLPDQGTAVSLFCLSLGKVTSTVTGHMLFEK